MDRGGMLVYESHIKRLTPEHKAAPYFLRGAGLVENIVKDNLPPERAAS